MRLFILARYHARAGHESAVEAALRDVTGPTREERGCLSETPTSPGLQARGRIGVRPQIWLVSHCKRTKVVAYRSQRRALRTSLPVEACIRRAHCSQQPMKQEAKLARVSSSPRINPWGAMTGKLYELYCPDGDAEEGTVFLLW